MAPNFSKNAILKGYVDYFCLICETYLRNEDETTKHISKESHRSNLSKTSYFKDFKEDYIKKINSKYFCEPCNKLMPVMAKVRIHITEPLHLDMKKFNVLSYRNNNVVAFNKVVINEHSWHGLYDTLCAVCNLEYDNIDEHKADVSHIIKLIQMRVEFHEDKYLYRKIDENIFQCLTCNTVEELYDLITHFEEMDHISKYQECCEAFHKLLQDGSDNNSDLQGSSNESKVNNKDKEVVKSSSAIIAESFDIITKERNEEMKVMNEPELNENRSEERKNSDFKYIFDEKCENEICKVLNAKDYITLNEKGSTWCILCNWVIKSQDVSYHIQGKHHQTIQKIHRERIEKYKNMNKVSKRTNNSNDTIENNSELLKFVDEFQKNGININFEYKSATCRKCSPANVLEFNYNYINNHINEHRNVSKKQTKTLPLPSCNAKVDEKKNMVCTSTVVKQDKVSKVEMERDCVKMSENNAAEDVKQNNQENEAEKKDGKIKNNKRITSKELSNDVTEQVSKDIQIAKRYKQIVFKSAIFKDFMESMTLVKYELYQDIIINNKFTINSYSFFCFDAKNNIIECFVCNENVTLDLLHITQCEKSDFKTMEEMCVITEIDSEFIREITHNKFHCGYCNCVVTSWEDMQVHLKTFLHKEAKSSAEWRLAQVKTEMTNLNIYTESSTGSDSSFAFNFFYNYYRV